MANKKPLEVITILGYKRIGSTLVHNILGQSDQYFAIGEIRNFYLRKKDKRVCGCGQNFEKCEFWSPIVSELGYPPNSKLLKDRYFPVMVLLYLIKPLRFLLKKELNYYTNFFSVLGDRIGERKLVDSSKSISFYLFLQMIHGVYSTPILVVKNPKSVLQSFRKRRIAGHKLYKNEVSVISLISMDITNLMSIVVVFMTKGKVQVLKFERFLKNPFDSLRSILRRQIDFGDILDDKNCIKIMATHSVGGSPSRLKTGNVKLENDSFSNKKGLYYIFSFTGLIYLKN